jgi:hypothetical protein
MEDSQARANPCNVPIMTRNEMTLAVRVRSSALLNSLSLGSSSCGGISRRLDPLPLTESLLATATSNWRELLGGQGDQDGLLMVVSGLAYPEGQRAAHVPPPTVPRSAHLLVPRALAAPPLASADPLLSGRVGSSCPPDAGSPALAPPCDTGGTSRCPSSPGGRRRGPAA